MSGSMEKNSVKPVVPGSSLTAERISPFLTAEWRDLVVLNFEIDRKLLEPYVPRGTEVDLWRDRALVSVVAFRFLKTRVKGFAIPFHTDFTEVNLRFYVRREAEEGIRRGVVFIKELVPRRAIAAVARLAYNENYFHAPLSHELKELGEKRFLKYGWKDRYGASAVSAETVGPPRPLAAGSESEFILEHYWGYSRARDGGTIEYAVRHPRWRAWENCEAALELAPGSYGPGFSTALQRAPVSAIVAEGSEISVHPGVRL